MIFEADGLYRKMMHTMQHGNPSNPFVWTTAKTEEEMYDTLPFPQGLNQKARAQLVAEVRESVGEHRDAGAVVTPKVWQTYLEIVGGRDPALLQSPSFNSETQHLKWLMTLISHFSVVHEASAMLCDHAESVFRMRAFPRLVSRPAVSVTSRDQ